MRKLIAVATTTAALTAGGFAAAVVNPLQGASAQAPPATSAAAPANPAAGALKRALDGLVKDGTITQAQADAVRNAILAQVRQGAAARRAGAAKLRNQAVAIVAQAIGITPAQLRAGLRAGHSIADQATAKGVDPKTVEAAIVAAASKRIDSAVTNGKLPPAQAAKLKARLADLAARIVNAKPGPRGGLRPGLRLPALRPGR